MSKRRVYYLDNNATTQIAPEVIEAMSPFLREFYGNPSSAYRFGKEVGERVRDAREKVAALVNAQPDEVIFTSCGTESNNSAIHSALLAAPGKRHVVTTAVEHPAIVNYCEFLQKTGYEVTFLPVDADGMLDLHRLEQAIRPDTAIVSVMWANNETGIVFPIEEITAICHAKNTLFHTDATQVPGKMNIDVAGLGVDFLTLSAHKLHAPKGIGMLYVNRRAKYLPYVIGGHQERGKRGGTENVAGIVAFGRAAELAMVNLQDEDTRVRRLRDRMENTILSTIPDTIRTGPREPRLPNTSNISFQYVEAEAILMMLDELGICASSGSACTTGSLTPSHVLTAMGLSQTRARGCIRLSLGIYNTDEDVDFLLSHLPEIIAKLRAISPLNRAHPEPAASCP